MLKETALANRLPIVTDRELLGALRRSRRVSDHALLLTSSQQPSQQHAVVGMELAMAKVRLSTAEVDARRQQRLAEARRARTPWRPERYPEWSGRVLSEDSARPTTASSFFRNRDLDDLWPQVQREHLYLHRPGVHAEVSAAPVSINWRRPESPRGADLCPQTKLLPFVVSLRTMRQEVRRQRVTRVCRLGLTRTLGSAPPEASDSIESFECLAVCKS